MRESSKAALCGIISALAIVIMLSTYISPLLVYTAPPMAGLLLLIIIKELGYKWASGAYVTISLLSVFLIADKESSVFFTFFFGYFPILSIFLNSKIKNRALNLILKLICFNCALILALSMCIFVLGLSFDDIFSDGVAFTIAFIVAFEILFFIYNLLVSRLEDLYDIKLKKTIRKLFNIK